MQLLKSLFGGDSNVKNIDVQEAKNMLSGDNPPLLVDVRQKDEYREGHVQGAKLIPLDQLGKRMNELPKDRTIMVICRSGGRSSAAASQLSQAGYQTINVRGGMMHWEGAGLPVKRGG